MLKACRVRWIMMSLNTYNPDGLPTSDAELVVPISTNKRTYSLTGSNTTYYDYISKYPSVSGIGSYITPTTTSSSSSITINDLAKAYEGLDLSSITTGILSIASFDYGESTNDTNTDDTTWAKDVDNLVKYLRS